MQFDFESLFDLLLGISQQILQAITDPFVIFQAIIIASIYLISVLLARKTEQRLEDKARNIKDSPGLMRTVIVLLRRLKWVYFVILIGAFWSILTNINWPSTYLLYVSLLFSFVWLLMAVLTQSIRNRTIRSFIAFSAWFYVALVILGIESNVADLLDAIGFSIGTFRLSLLLAIKIVVTMGIGLWASVSFSDFIDRRLHRNDEFTPGLSILLGKIIRITLIVVAAVIAISAIGIDLTVLSVLTGAIGVGIGFGLQKVVSNFISGLIILADRSIKPGDTISLGETFGWIRELRARFISVVTRDGREYLIPNEDFITREVINWSFSDELVRLDVNFGVSYDSNPHQVSELAIAAVLGVDRVVANNPPACWLTSFGDSSLDFVLRFWIRDPQAGLTNIRGKVLLALWDIFKENGIAIPYPHRQLVFKNSPVLPLPESD